MILRWSSPLRLILALARAIVAWIRGREIILSREAHDRRVAVCETCPWLETSNSTDPLDWQCKACTCFVEVKAWATTETCPTKRWPVLPLKYWTTRLRKSLTREG